MIEFSVVYHKFHNAGESAIEGQRRDPLNAASLHRNRALFRPSGVRAQGAVPAGTVPLAQPC